MELDAALAALADPPREFGLIPFWFWNDDLQEDELIRQLRAFHEAGFGGVLPHARTGLSPRVGYLTPEYFRLLRLVVAEAERLEMKVILYDEGSYPSGSANGRVVAANPAWASQAIGLWEQEVEGPHCAYWRPNTGRALLDRHVATAVGRLRADGSVESETVELLSPLPRDLFRLEVPLGRWKVMSVWNTCSGGRIRGVLPEEEDGHATAPPAGDLLNPEAVACFIRLTHDRYYEHLREFFGSTVIALFTDEPGVMGRGAQRPARPHPYTPGFLEWLERRWGRDPRPWLPALWLDYGPGTDGFRAAYAEAVQARLREVFYGAQSRWCARHGIALTGHPSGSNEMAALRLFQIPGQDMVWRWVIPDSPSALEGPHSVAAKAATSGARLQGARRVLSELGGAYGWRLNLDELKWLIDWHLVRGNNLLNPHAVFYSIRGRRAWESEPDLGIHNVWWPHFHRLARYARRLCALLTDGEEVCQVAILGDGQALPWQAARQLYRAQIDFLYLDAEAVAAGEVRDGHLRVASQRYRVVVVDGDPAAQEPARPRLEELRRAGGGVIDGRGEPDLPALIDRWLPRDLRLEPPCPDLRFLHLRRDGLEWYLLTNEGEGSVCGSLFLRCAGGLVGWDPLTASRLPLRARRRPDGLEVELALERRQSVVLGIDPAARFAPPPEPPRFAEARLPLEAAWRVLDPSGRPVDAPALGDWARHPGLELFTGTLCYCARVDLPAAGVGLDLGAVGDLAEVLLDGQPCGVRLWAPYRLDLGPAIQPGVHDLEVRVTNSMANAFEGAQLPSGLMGPVHLLPRHHPPTTP